MRVSIRTLLLLLGFIALLGVGIISRPAAAQTVNASLGGVVSDATGARLADATVTVANEASGDSRKTKTNRDGVYQFSSLPPGSYSLTIEHDGFDLETLGGIELHPSDSRTLKAIQLTIGAITETVKVEAENEVIDTSERSSLISSEDIKKLSTVGRDASELLKTQPGFAMVQSGLDNSVGSDPSVVGSGGGMGNYVGGGAPANGASLISDGSNVTDPGNGSGQTQTVNMDMVSEIKIETSNFGADSAKGPIVITAVGKSGSSEYHGTVYSFGRTSQLNTKDWFMKNQGLGQLPDRYIYPGFSVGGPVRIPGTRFNNSKKLVFYAGGEDYIQRNVYAYGSPINSFSHALVPTDVSTNKMFGIGNQTAGMRQGNFSQAELASYLGTTIPNIQANCNTTGTMSQYIYSCGEPATAGNTGNDLSIGAIGSLGGQFKQGFNASSQALMNALMPLPSGPTSSSGYNYQALNLENPDNWQFRTRVDVGINDNNKLYAVFNTQNGHTAGIPEQFYYSPTSGSLAGGVDTPGKIISDSKSNTGSLNYTRIFSARATNEIYGALSYVADYYTSGDESKLLAANAGYSAKDYLYPYNASGKTGSLQFPQLATWSTTSGSIPMAITPDFTWGRSYSRKFLPNGGDNFNILLGKHSLKLGAYVERDTANQTNLDGTTNGTLSTYYVGSTVTDSDNTQHIAATCSVYSGCKNYLADMMLGYFGAFSQQNFNPSTNLYYWTIAGFAQDSWKPTKKLTIDLGIRFDHLGDWSDNHGLGIAAFSTAWYNADAPVLSRNGTGPTLPGVRWHGNDSSVPLSGAKSRLGFFSPRGGLAYDVYGNGHTVVRGGWGMYRSHDSWNDYSIPAETAEGSVTSYLGGGGTSFRNVEISSSLPAQCDASNTNGCPSISALDANDNQQPLTMTYSMTISQRAPWDSAFEIAYQGNQSQDLLTDSVSTTLQGNVQNINAIPMGGMFKPDPVTSSTYYGQIPTPNNNSTASFQDDYRPFPYYTNLLVPRHIVWANYNSLQTSWNRRKGRLNYGVNYTWSKALGVRGGYANGVTADPTNFRADYGPLAFDRTHVVNATYSYDEGKLFHRNRLVNILGNNWMVSGISTIQSGPNMQAIYSPDLGLSGIVSDVVNGVHTNGGTALTINSLNILGTPDIYVMPTLKCNPTANLQKNQFINGNCFGIPSYGTNGAFNLGYIRGPKFLSNDLTVQKRIELADKRSIELKAAGFNFLNHPITTFSSRFPEEANLTMHGADFGSATLQNNTNSTGNCSDSGSTCFGYAGYKTGRRVMELSARFNF